MKRMNVRRWIWVLGLVLALGGSSVRAAATTDPVVDDFALIDQYGRQHQLYKHSDVPVIVLYSYQTGCPIARQDMASLTLLGGQFKNKAVIALIDPAPGDDRATVLKETTELGAGIPALLDPSQAISQSLGIDRTGEAIVIRTRDWKIAWRGPVDDRLGYGAQRPEAHRQYLAEAIDAVIAGKPTPSDAPAAKGCRITMNDPQAQIDYARDVAPLLSAHCLECHQPGAIGPFAMNGYEHVRDHAAMIRETLRTRRMPPFGADAPSGCFVKDNVLGPSEVAKLARWIDAGSARGNGPDPLEKPLPPVSEWTLGKPDMIVECPEENIPATGVINYINFELPLFLTEDRWVRAVEIHPSDPKVMHHAVAFVLNPGEAAKSKRRNLNAMEDYFAEYVPGAGPQVFPEGTGKPLRKGSKISFQLHYTTNGKASVDRPKLGIYFASSPPARELKVGSAHRQDFKIPPGDRDYAVSAKWTAKGPITLYGLAPHMHLRGSRMSFEAKLPDGSVQPLLSVPRYDFNWQSTYWLAKPVLLPAGTTITCSGAYDNSTFNEANPDATKTVHWGEQSFDEMFIGYILYADQ